MAGLGLVTATERFSLWKSGRRLKSWLGSSERIGVPSPRETPWEGLRGEWTSRKGVFRRPFAAKGAREAGGRLPLVLNTEEAENSGLLRGRPGFLRREASPNFTFLRGIHRRTGPALEVLGKVPGIGDGPDDSEAGRAVGVRDESFVGALRGTDGTPDLGEARGKRQGLSGAD